MTLETKYGKKSQEGHLETIKLPLGSLQIPCCYYEAKEDKLLIFGAFQNRNLYSYDFGSNILSKIGQIPYSPFIKQRAIKLDEEDDNVIVAGNDEDRFYFYLYKISEHKVINLNVEKDIKLGFDAHKINKNAFIVSYRKIIEIYTFKKDKIQKLKQFKLNISYDYNHHKIFYKNNLLFLFIGHTEYHSLPFFGRRQNDEYDALEKLENLKDDDLVQRIDEIRAKDKHNEFANDILQKMKEAKTTNISDKVKWDDFYVTKNMNNFWENIKIFAMDENHYDLNEMDEKQQIIAHHIEDQKEKYQEVRSYGLAEYQDNIIIVGGRGHFAPFISIYNISSKKWVKAAGYFQNDSFNFHYIALFGCCDPDTLLLNNETLCIVQGSTIYKIKVNAIGLPTESAMTVKKKDGGQDSDKLPLNDKNEGKEEKKLNDDEEDVVDHIHLMDTKNAPKILNESKNQNLVKQNEIKQCEVVQDHPHDIDRAVEIAAISTNEKKVKKQKISPKESVKNQFFNFLNRNNLDEYMTKFEEAKCCDLELVEDFDDDFLRNDIGIKSKILRKRLLKKCVKMKTDIDRFKDEYGINEFLYDRLSEYGLITMNILCKEIKSKWDLTEKYQINGDKQCKFLLALIEEYKNVQQEGL